MRKLYDSYGEYIPGFFKISINRKLSENMLWTDFSQEDKATLIHEYVHFLQDVTTTRGVNNFIYVSKMLQMNFAKAYEQGDTISLPLNIEAECGETVYQEGELQSFYAGSNTHIKIHHINRIVREEDEIMNMIVNLDDPLFAINVYYDDKDIPYVFGIDAVAESMAYIIESEKVDGLKRINEFPYNLCELFCKEYCMQLLENKAVLVAACELSLMHYHAGDMFWHIIMEIRKNNFTFKNVDEFEQYFFQRTYFLYQDMSEILSGAYSSIDFLYPTSNCVTSLLNYKVKNFMKKGNDFRTTNKLFIAKIMESNNPIVQVNTWMNYFGIPILCDSENNIYAGDDLSGMMAPLALYNFFMRCNGNECDMVPFCCTQKIETYNHDICMNKPWMQADKRNFCLFGMYWHIYSLEGKKVFRKQ